MMFAYLGQELEIELIKRLVPLIGENYFIDIGAEKGAFSNVMFEMGMHGAMFEPMGRHLQHLQPLAEKYGAHLYQWAIAETDGERDLFIATDSDGRELDFFHSLRKVNITSQFEHSKSIRVHCRSLSSLAADGLIPRSIGILKTDTEGNDLFVLRGMVNIVPELVICEYFTEGLYTGWQDASPEPIIDLMRGKGYSHYLATKHAEGFEYCAMSPCGFNPKQWGNLFFFSESLYKNSKQVLGEFLALSEEHMVKHMKNLLNECHAKELVIRELTASRHPETPSLPKAMEMRPDENQNSIVSSSFGMIDIVTRLTAAHRQPSWYPVAIDVGAHNGSFTRSLINTGLFKKIFAFEPNPMLLPEIQGLAAQSQEVEALPFAVGDLSGQFNFSSTSDFATGSLFPYENNFLKESEVHQFSVPVVTLDSMLDRFELNGGRIELIKIDTQGADALVIKGASTLLSKHRPLLIVEFIYTPLYVGQGLPEEINQLLSNAGYRFFSLSNIHVDIHGQLAYADSLFVPVEMDIPASYEYYQIDNQESLREQLRILKGICEERLNVINQLDAEVKRLSKLTTSDHSSFLGSIYNKVAKWVQ